MKTIQELNSKWYWRLVKVFYCILLLVILLGTLWLSFDYLQTYNPEKIKDIKITYNDIVKRVNFLNSNFSDKTITKDIILEKKLENKDIVLLLALWNHNNKWDLWFYESNLPVDAKKCGEEIQKYRNWEITIIDWSLCWISIFKKSLNEILSIPSDWENSNFYIETLYETLKSWKHIYQDYFWLKQFIFFVAYWIGILVIFWILTFIFRWIIYYIILWKFNPEK